MFSKIQMPSSNTNQNETQNCENNSYYQPLRSKICNTDIKLEEIAQLETKKQLTLEQQEKISQKDQLILERSKYKDLMKTYTQSTSEEQTQQKKIQPSELKNLTYFMSNQEGFVRQGNSVHPKYSAECSSNQSQPISPRSQIERETEIQYLEQEQIEDTQQRHQQIQSPLTPQFRQSSLHLDQINKQIYHIEIHEPLIQERKYMIKNQKENKQNDKSQNVNFGQKNGTSSCFPQDKRLSKHNKNKILRPASQRDKNDQQYQNSSSQEQSVGDFKKKQIREFIQNGFISAGKAKTKSKDQKQYHDHEHGKKHHHNHHSKKNF